MADIIDQAQDTHEKDLAQSLRAQSIIAARTLRPAPIGHCLNEDCGEPFDPGSPRLFCGPDCATRYEHLHNRSRQGGTRNAGQ